MKNSTRFILIILLLVFTWWLQNLLESKPELITREKSRFANYYLQDFKLTAHNKDGLVRYVLQAKRLDNYKQESLAELTDIQAEIINKGSHWRISAKQAKLYQDKNIIEFYGDVKIIRPAQADSAELKIQTDKIKLFTEQEKLLTDSHITIDSGTTQITSKGLSYDGNKGILELKADVKGRYVK